MVSSSSSFVCVDLPLSFDGAWFALRFGAALAGRACAAGVFCFWAEVRCWWWVAIPSEGDGVALYDVDSARRARRAWRVRMESSVPDGSDDGRKAVLLQGLLCSLSRHCCS